MEGGRGGMWLRAKKENDGGDCEGEQRYSRRGINIWWRKQGKSLFLQYSFQKRLDLLQNSKGKNGAKTASQAAAVVNKLTQNRP